MQADLERDHAEDQLEFRPMTLAQFTIHANRILSLHHTLEISDEEMYNIFEKPERKTPLGNAAANFCGLPTETKTLAQWLKANELIIVRNIVRGAWVLMKKEPEDGRDNLHRIPVQNKTV